MIKTFGWRCWLGVVACIVLIISCFMHWAWYPDIQEFFTGFYSRNNYYGKPGILLSVFAGLGVVFFLVNKVWSLRLNLLFSALGAAYAVANFLKYSGSYDGIVPDKQAGIYLMIISAVGFLIMSFLSTNMQKVEIPVEEPTTEK